MEPIGFPETSVKNCYSTLCNIRKERRSQIVMSSLLQLLAIPSALGHSFLLCS